MRLVRQLTIGLSSVACWLALTATAGAATPSSLVGVAYLAGSSPVGTCNATGSSTYTFGADGTTSSPYASGVAFESGSFTIENGFLTSFSATLSIFARSGAVVRVTKTVTPGTVSASCANGITLTGTFDYTATITTADGVYSTSGTGSLYYRYNFENQLQQYFTEGTLPTLVLTAARVTGMSARRASTGVSIAWRTASEIDILGFNVYRERNGRRVRVNAKLIAAHGRGAYSFLDRKAPAGKPARYWLQIVGLDGVRSWFGPALVRGSSSSRGPVSPG